MLFNLGIETALTFATVVSGIIWLGYAILRRLKPSADVVLNEKKDEESEAETPMLADYAKSFFPIFLLVLLLRTFVAEPFRIPSGSMMPTLLVGDFILVEKYAYGLRLPVVRNKVLD
ncbi:MAG: S26 family signal peptidase, partial [bacterium]